MGNMWLVCARLHSSGEPRVGERTMRLFLKFVWFFVVECRVRRYKLNSPWIGARGIGPLSGGIVSCQFFYRAWGTLMVTGCCCAAAVNTYFILYFPPPPSLHSHPLSFPSIPIPSSPPPTSPPTHIHSHVFLRAVPVPQGPHGEASH
jgi:hypothetical protein